MAATTTTMTATTTTTTTTVTTEETTNDSLTNVQPELTTTLSETVELNQTDQNSDKEQDSEKPTWPGWPGDCVFRLIVPVLKVGSIIGRKGELIKKICEQTGARIRILEAPMGTADRVVLISGKEDLEAPFSPAMDAVRRVCKRVIGLPEDDADECGSAGVAFSSFKLLVPNAQALDLIGKQGSVIKAIQESSGATIRVLTENEALTYVAADERIVDLQGEALKLLKAVEAVVSHLRKFLVDHSVLPLFEKNYNALISQESQRKTLNDNSLLHSAHAGIGIDSLLARREALLFEQESQLVSKLVPARTSIHGRDSLLSTNHSSVLNHASVPVITQVTQTMQVPISCAEDIIGVQGCNIAFIRRTSGAIITVHESKKSPDEIIVELEGSAQEVQIAKQLIQDCLSNHQEPVSSGYGNYVSEPKSLYPQLENSYYHSSPSATSGQAHGKYGSSGLGGNGTLRL